MNNTALALRSAVLLASVSVALLVLVKQAGLSRDSVEVTASGAGSTATQRRETPVPRAIRLGEWTADGRPLLESSGSPTPTPGYRPLLPTTIPSVAVPTPDAQVAAWPTRTPLPAVPAQRRLGWWPETVAVGQPLAFGGAVRSRAGWAAWSPDGSQLAISSPDGTWLLDAQGKRVWEQTSIVLLDPVSRSAAAIAQGFQPHWSPDGAHLAYFAYTDSLDVLFIRVLNLQNRQVTEVARVPRGEAFPTAAWLSATELAFSQAAPRVFDLRTSRTRPLVDGDTLARTSKTRPLKYVVASPSSGVLGVASGTEILLLRWQNGAASLLRHIPQGLDGASWGISPGGDLLAFVSSTSRQVTIATTSPSDPLIELPRTSRAGATSVSWAPDGASLIYAGSDGARIVGRDGSGLRTLPAIASPIGWLAWSPAGAHIATASPDGELRLYSVAQR